MKTQITFLLLFLVAFSIFGQKSFHKGYFVTNNGERIDCFINDKDGLNSPTSLLYKLSENVKTERISIDSIAMFEIPGYDKYICKEVRMDMSIDELSNLTTSKDPIWETRRIALKTLVEGKASLYVYRNKDVTRFFYAVDNAEPRQLVYRQYIDSSSPKNNILVENNGFIQQLSTEFTNPSFTNRINKLQYEETDLKRFFVQYNTFESTSSTADVFNATPKVKRDKFKVTVKAGVNHSVLDVERLKTSMNNFSFDPLYAPYLGLDLEFVLPFFRNKLSCLFQTVYNFKVSGEKQILLESNSELANITYSYHSFEVPLGIRYRYFLNNDFRIYASAYSSLGLFSWIKSKASLNGFYFETPNSSILGVGCGVGAEYKKWGVELKYMGTADLLERSNNFMSEYKVLSLGITYNIIDQKRSR